MTFSYKIKEEISKQDCSRLEKISELSGILKTSADIKMYCIRIQTENINAANRIFKIIKELYDVTANITIRKNYNFKKNEIYIIEVKKNVLTIIQDLGLVEQGKMALSKVPNESVVSDNELKSAFIRGCFLICGSVNDPKTSRYHLEFLIQTVEFANFLCKLLNDYKLNAKVLRRKKGYMVYIKESEKISDLLKLLRAYDGVMYFEDVRSYREKINMTNRLNNCEQANTFKSMQSAQNQIKEIEYIKEHDAYDILDEKLKLVAEYRIKYPESSLIELSEIITIETGSKMTKSCLNHRFRKIKELKEKLK